MSTLTALLRPHHWIKNFFLFLPAFFAARLLEQPLLLRAILGFVAFSLVASAVYIFNDMVDRVGDRLHPRKMNRPLAQGTVQIQTAGWLLLAMLLPGLLLAWKLGTEPLFFMGSYFLVNVLYSIWLKNIALVDVSIIGLGFLLRIFAGGAVTGVAVSNWLIVLTFLLALILGLAKRRGEYVIASEGHQFRRSLAGYNLLFLDVSITVCATVAIVAYLMYCFSPEVTQRIGSDKIYYTAFFVILGILRYLQLALVYNSTESPTRALIQDFFLQVVLLCWIGSFVYLLYW